MNTNWEWFGHAGHFIGSGECLFRMCTLVGNYLVSSVGEYYPIHSSKRKLTEIGADRRLYETMVFKVDLNNRCKCGCGLPTVTDYLECDMLGYKTAENARNGHIEMCKKWDKIQGEKKQQ